MYGNRNRTTTRRDISRGGILGALLEIVLTFHMQMFTRRKRGDVDDELPKKIGAKNVGRSRISAQGSHNFQGQTIVKHES